MAKQAPIEDQLARLGRAQAHDEPGEQRKLGIKAQLFGDDLPPRLIGRFVDLGSLGQGAMGVVRRAYDQRLAREVAIKLVRNRSPRHQDRLLREAQALAQVSHPNVVQVYEVGEIEGEIFIAMELVDGTPLDAWHVGSRTWRECAEVYLQAGRGLAAAHAKQLVHRDFKPSNCILDTAGRVRVLDFGLARTDGPGEPVDERPRLDVRSVATTTPAIDPSAGATARSDSMLRLRLTADHAVVGTVAYMAPEQLAGQRADASSDQFSFCVALHEALYGVRPFGEDPRPALIEMMGGVDRVPACPATPRPVPARLRRILRRGLAARPDARWPSMDALLRELERALGRPKWMVASMLAVVVATGGSAYAVSRDGDDPCRDGARRDDVWGESQREEVRTALMESGAPYAPDVWQTVDRELGIHADAWEQASLSTCHDRALDLAEHAARQRCLLGRRSSILGRVELLSNADPRVVEHAVGIVATLPSAAACLEAAPPPDAPAVSPEDQQKVDAIAEVLDRARMLDAAAQYDEGIAIAAEAVAGADALGDRSLLAHALLVEGHLRMDAGQPQEAEAALARAFDLGLRYDDDEVVVEASALRSRVVGIDLGLTERSRPDADLAVKLSARTVVSPSARALALTTHGYLSTARGEFEPARLSYEEAIAILEREHGEDHLALVEPLDGLAQAYRRDGQLDRALALRERALEIHRSWLGDQHPETALKEANLAAILYDQREYAKARELLELAIASLRAVLGPDHPLLAAPHNGLAAVLDKLDEPEKAEQEYLEAIRIWERAPGAPHPDAAAAHINLAQFFRGQGRTEAAIEHDQSALELLDRSEPSPARTRLAAQALRDLGRLHSDRGEPERAEARYREGLDRLERGGLDEDAMMASLLNHLGHLVLGRGDAVDAEGLHLRALAIYERAHGPTHAKVARTHHNLALALIQQQQWTRAEDHIRQALHIYEQPGSGATSDLAEAQQLLEQITAAR